MGSRAQAPAGYMSIDHGGTGWAKVQAANARQVRDGLTGQGLTPEDVDRFLQCTARTDFRTRSMTGRYPRMPGLSWGNADPSSSPGADGGTRAAGADQGCATPSAVRTAASVALAAVSGLIASAAARQFTRAGTTLDPSDPTRVSVLVTTGANSVTRNPMYVGLSGLLLAYAIRRGSWTALLPVAAFVVVIDRLQILSEEAALSAQFGIDYEDYRQRVPRWLGPI